MVPVQNASIILLMLDSGFYDLCEDPDAYFVRLKKILNERSVEKITLMTVSGKYGPVNVPEASDIKVIELEDKNKTVFSQALENVANLFDEMLVISNVANDNFIDAAKDVMGNASKTITIFGYPRKKKKGE